MLPGDYTRGEAIKQQAKLAAQLVFGIVSMLFFAGIIEGFISPVSWIPASFKYVLGTALFLGLLSYASRQRKIP